MGAMGEIHNIGQRSTKYKKIEPSKAPLAARSACRYTSDFRQKPLGDHECCRDIAETLRDMSWNGSSPDLAIPSPSFPASASYAKAFPGHRGEQLRMAKQAPTGYKMAKTKTVP